MAGEGVESKTSMGCLPWLPGYLLGVRFRAISRGLEENAETSEDLTLKLIDGTTIGKRQSIKE